MRFLTICDVQECAIPQDEVVEVAHPVLEKDTSTLHAPQSKLDDMCTKRVKRGVQDEALLSWLAPSSHNNSKHNIKQYLAAASATVHLWPIEKVVGRRANHICSC